jgi:hypothetical protein
MEECMKTVKEKAFELVTTFYLVNSESVELINGDHEIVFSLSLSDARKCALIAVDELIKIAPWGCNIDYEFEEGTKEYYQAVKEQIKNYE